MNNIELIVATSSVIVALSIAFIVYVLLKPRKEVKKEQVTIEANLEDYDERPALRERITFLEAEIEKFATICDGLTAANKKCLDEFEAYVRLTQGEQEKPVKRSVTSLKDKECIRIGEGDWDKLAPLFDEAGIIWHGGEKASEYIPEIGNCVFFNSFGQNELTQGGEYFHIQNGYTVLPASDFIEEIHSDLAPLNPTDHPNHPEFKNK